MQTASHSYILNHATDPASLATHYMFYVLCQAVLYIFCFRVGDFADMDGGEGFLQDLRLDDVVACSLKPLRVCKWYRVYVIWSWYLVRVCMVFGGT